MVTTAVTTVVTTSEKIVSVFVNDSGQLVVIDNTGAETVLDESRTYAAEQQPDGSVKIVDEDGAAENLQCSRQADRTKQDQRRDLSSGGSQRTCQGGQFIFLRHDK